MAKATARPVLTVAVAGALVACSHIWWVARHRLQGGFDGDEATYLSIALRYRSARQTFGLDGLGRTVLETPRNGPLTPLLSSFVVVGRNPLASALAVQAVLVAVAAVAVAVLARRLAGRGPALVAGIVVLGLPGMIVAARAYQPVPAVTATLAVAVAALVASDRGRRMWLLAVFGAAVGAMLLSRSMTVAFVPGLAVAAVIVLGINRRALRGVALAAVAASVIAGPWWASQFQASIAPYLWRYGYTAGNDTADDLGPASPLLRLLIRLGLLIVDVRAILLVPALVLAALAGWELVRRVRRSDVASRRSAALAILGRHRELVAVWVVVVMGWTALLSSRNTGTYFQLPLTVLAVAGMAGLSPLVRPPALRRLGAVFVVAAVVNLALVSRVDLGTTVRMGGGTLAFALWAGSEGSQAIDFENGDRRFSATASWTEREEAMRDWAEAQNATAAAVDELTPSGGEVYQTFVGDIRLFQASTLELAARLTKRGVSPWEAPTARSRITDAPVSYAPMVGDRPRVIVAVRAASYQSFTGQEGYSPDPVLEESAAHGWQVARRIPLPDGGEVRILTHPDNQGRGGHGS